MPYFRFPGGCYDSRALRKLSAFGMTAVQWDVVSGDAFATDADDVVREVLDGVRRGHALHAECRAGHGAGRTGRSCRRSRARGFRFVKVSELVGATAVKAP